MAYCTQAELEAFLTGQLKLDTELRLTSDEIAAQIASADREIDIYLAGVASTPFTTVPDAVKEISLRLAAANCLDAGRTDFALVQGTSGEPGTVPRSQALRSQAHRLLERVMENPEILGTSGPSVTAATLYKSYDAFFTEEDMENW